jgi:multidrug transporter EmrE-like cation transporter
MTAFVVDWKIYGHSLSLVQMSGLALMAIAIWSVKSSR